MIKTEINIKTITDFLNGVNVSIKNIIPLSLQIGKPSILTVPLQLQFGVLIGVVGEVRGKILFAGEQTVFSDIASAMYGMTIEGAMLASFSGELGNMIAAGISTHMASQGVTTDITSPSIIEGNTKLSGFERAYHIQASCGSAGILHIYVLLD